MKTSFAGHEFKGMVGAFAAMITPFDKKGALNEEAIDQLIEYGIGEGLKGFYLTGSMGDTFSGGIGLNYNIIPRHRLRKLRSAPCLNALRGLE